MGAGGSVPSVFTIVLCKRHTQRQSLSRSEKSHTGKESKEGSLVVCWKSFAVESSTVAQAQTEFFSS